MAIRRNENNGPSQDSLVNELLAFTSRTQCGLLSISYSDYFDSLQHEPKHFEQSLHTYKWTALSRCTQSNVNTSYQVAIGNTAKHVSNFINYPNQSGQATSNSCFGSLKQLQLMKLTPKNDRPKVSKSNVKMWRGLQPSGTGFPSEKILREWSLPR